MGSRKESSYVLISNNRTAQHRLHVRAEEGLLGGAACEDLRSGSIIVVISTPRCKPRAPRQSAPTSLLLSRSAASQGNRERATGHGYTAARLHARARAGLRQQHSCLFIWKRGHGRMFISPFLSLSLSLLPVQMFIRPAVSMKGC